jgi:hypothetical protein
VSLTIPQKVRELQTALCAKAKFTLREITRPNVFRFWAEGDWWGFPFFSLNASRYFGDKETLCLYWPLGTVVITGPKVLDFYAGFCEHRATSRQDARNLVIKQRKRKNSH